MIWGSLYVVNLYRWQRNLTDISKRTGIPTSTIYDRIRTNRNKIIKRYTTLIDFQKLGFGCRVNLVFKVKKKDRDKLGEFLTKNQRVNTLYRINNGYDFFAECIFRHVKEVETFFEICEDKFDLQDKKVYYIIDEIGKEMFLTDRIHAELVMKI